MDMSSVRLAMASALVPTLLSSQRPAGTKFTVSALRRITRPPYVQRMRVSASVTAMTRSPSSAVRRSSGSTRSTAVWSGESRQYAVVSPSSASGASTTSGVIAWPDELPAAQDLRAHQRSRLVAELDEAGPRADGVEPPSLELLTHPGHVGPVSGS